MKVTKVETFVARVPYKHVEASSLINRGGISDNAAVSPSTSNRLRGIGSVDSARDYYPSVTQFTFDVYNTESVEINRGPNSLLFGLGSPSGIVNQSSSKADLRRVSRQVSARSSRRS